jgi:lysophospholipase L1-like esterase
MCWLTLGLSALACSSDEDNPSTNMPLNPASGGTGAQQGAAQGGTSGTSAMPTGGAGGANPDSSNMPDNLAGGSGGTGNSNGSNGNGGSATAGSGGSQSSSGQGGSGGSGTGGSGNEPPAFAPCPSVATPCRIMPLGDSITDGVGAPGGGAYRIELFRQAVAAGENITFVGLSVNGPNNIPNVTPPFPRNHEGHSGFTISGGGAGSLAGLVDNAIAQTDPNIILLMIGTNDMNGNINVAQAPARLDALLGQIIEDAPDALLVVAQIIPITQGAGTARVQPYNAAIPGLVQARANAGQHIMFVDMFTPFNSTPNFAQTLMNDFLHPNTAGYVVMGQTWHDAIEDFLPNAP